MTKNILITGGCGFIGSNFIAHIFDKYDYNIWNVDSLTYAANTSNLREEIRHSSRYHFLNCDINNFKRVRGTVASNEIKFIVNFAAESHVDNSISNSSPFIHSNINGTHTLLTLLHDYDVEKYLQIRRSGLYRDSPHTSQQSLLCLQVFCRSSLSQFFQNVWLPNCYYSLLQQLWTKPTSRETHPSSN